MFHKQTGGRWESRSGRDNKFSWHCLDTGVTSGCLCVSVRASLSNSDTDSRGEKRPQIKAESYRSHLDSFYYFIIYDYFGTKNSLASVVDSLPRFRFTFQGFSSTWDETLSEVPNEQLLYITLSCGWWVFDAVSTSLQRDWMLVPGLGHREGGGKAFQISWWTCYITLDNRGTTLQTHSSCKTYRFKIKKERYGRLQAAATS